MLPQVPWEVEDEEEVHSVVVGGEWEGDEHNLADLAVL